MESLARRLEQRFDGKRAEELFPRISKPFGSARIRRVR
jgi:hypothetical protein